MDKIEEIAEFLFQELRGTCTDTFSLIEQYIEEEVLPREFFLANELEILRSLDDKMFCCECCGWNCENSEMSEEDMICSDCYGEGDET